MNGLLKVGLPAAAVAVLMGVTNPKPEAYSTYVSERMVSKGEKVACDRLSVCDKGNTPELVKVMARTTLKPLIDSTTTRRNLGLLSLYKTDVPGVGSMKSVGALGRFFTYSET